MLSNIVTLVDFVELDMFDLDVIFGIDWSCACYSSKDWRTMVLQFQFPNETIFKWNGGNTILRGQIISCIKDCSMISKGCLYHVMRVKDLKSEIPHLERFP